MGHTSHITVGEWFERRSVGSIATYDEPASASGSPVVASIPDGTSSETVRPDRSFIRSAYASAGGPTSPLSPDDVDLFRFFEQCEDEAAFGAHAESDHFERFEADLLELLAGEPTVTRLEVESATDVEL